MTEEQKLQNARQIYQTMCSALDSYHWNYEKNEEKLTITCSARGDDLPVELTAVVDAGRQLTMVLSQLPVTVPEDKRIDTALAVCVANDMMVHVSFDLDMSSGRIYFRMSNSFIDSQPGEELFFYLILCTCKMVDEYNDRFLMLAKDMIDLKKFIELANN